MNFLGAVNRVLINNLIIQGDDDEVTTFDDNQHEATIRIARQAIQTELNGFLSFFTVDKERATGTITTVDGQRVYTLPTDFVRFWGRNPFFYLTSDASDRLYEWNGGEENLREVDHLYQTTEGVENWWYWATADQKSVAFYNVPDADGREYTFDYEKDSSVTLATDELPFHTESEAQAFADMASRRFKYMREEGLDTASLPSDNEYVFNQGTLMNLLRNRSANTRYGRRYR